MPKIKVLTEIDTALYDAIEKGILNHVASTQNGSSTIEMHEVDKDGKRTGNVMKRNIERIFVIKDACGIYIIEKAKS